MTPTLYVLTYYRFNHDPAVSLRGPLDNRFLKSDKNIIYYLIDTELPSVLENKKVIFEKDLDPMLYEAGAAHLGEWSFLLAEEKHSFCTYPFYMISSRFYQKNNWLTSDLNAEWDTIFNYLNEYGWCYLPSYDRPMRWIDLEWKSKLKKEAWKHKFFPFTEKTFELIEQLYGVRLPDDYPLTADLLCNYIGFKSREHLLDYVNFYKPLIHALFDEQYQPRCDLSEYARKTGHYRNEKPVTFILEWFSHLYFFAKNKNYACLHYDGYYEVDERNSHMKKLQTIAQPLAPALYRYLRWKWRELKTEGVLAPIIAKRRS